jgi:L-threonylcarbamoyladenylate synthase
MNTKIFNINKNSKLFNKSALDIKKGKIAVFVTDTVYGIGCNALDKKAVSKIYKLKKRYGNKPLPLLMTSIKKVKEIAQWNECAKKLAKKFLPGALTLILKLKRKKDNSSLYSIKGGWGDLKNTTIAIRIPNHKQLLKWLKFADVPIASTSANLSGKSPIIKEQDIIKQFDGKVDYILTDGNLKTKESTIVNLTAKKPVILRESTITKSQIKKVI